MESTPDDEMTEARVLAGMYHLPQYDKLAIVMSEYVTYPMLGYVRPAANGGTEFRPIAMMLSQETAKQLVEVAGDVIDARMVVSLEAPDHPVSFAPLNFTYTEDDVHPPYTPVGQVLDNMGIRRLTHYDRASNNIVLTYIQPRADTAIRFTINVPVAKHMAGHLYPELVAGFRENWDTMSRMVNDKRNLATLADMIGVTDIE